MTIKSLFLSQKFFYLLTQVSLLLLIISFQASAQCHYKDDGPGGPGGCKSNPPIEVKTCPTTFYAHRECQSDPQQLVLKLKDDTSRRCTIHIQVSGNRANDKNIGGPAGEFTFSGDDKKFVNGELTLEIIYKASKGDNGLNEKGLFTISFHDDSCNPNRSGEVCVRLDGQIIDQSPTILINRPTDEIQFLINLSDPLNLPITPIQVEISGSNSIFIKITDIKFFDMNDVPLKEPSFEINKGLMVSPIDAKINQSNHLTFTIVPKISDFGNLPPKLSRIKIFGKAECFSETFTIADIVTTVVGDRFISAPTLSEWGAIIMALLFLVTGTVFIIQRRPITVLQSTREASLQAETQREVPLLAVKVFSKVLLGVLLMFFLGLVVAWWLFGSISSSDIGGTLLCSIIFAYLVHLLFVVADDYK
jgi:hypothetical protein